MTIRSPILLGIIAALVIGITIEESLRRRPTVQVPACFERIAEGFSQHDPGTVMACIHRDYDFHQQWPQVFENPETARDLAAQLLVQLFLMGRSNPTTLTWSIASLHPMPEPNPHGRWEALATVSVSGDPFARATPKPLTLRFVLQRGSWLTGRWQIVDHDHIDLHGAESW
jgi:hypothetical protein